MASASRDRSVRLWVPNLKGRNGFELFVGIFRKLGSGNIRTRAVISSYFTGTGFGPLLTIFEKKNLSMKLNKLF